MKQIGPVITLMNTIDIPSIEFRVSRDTFVGMDDVNCVSLD